MLPRGSYQVKLLQTLRDHSDDVSCCDFGANYLLASGSGDKTVRVWEWKKGSGYVEKSYSPLAAHRYAVTSVRFSSLGTMLASSSTDGSTILWNVWTGVRIHTFVQRNGCPVRLSIFSPDSTLLVSAGDDGAVCIWDLLRRVLIRSFQAHRTTIQAMAITPDSKFLLTTDTLGMLKLWKDLEELPPESAPPSPLPGMAPTLADLGTSAEPADNSESLIMLVEDTHDLGVTGADFSLNHETSAEGAMVKRYTLATCGNNSVVRVWSVIVTLNGKPLQLAPASPTSTSTSPSRLGMTKHSLAAPPLSPVDGGTPPPLSPPASPNSLQPQHSFRRRESSIRRRKRQCRIAERLTLAGHGSAVTGVRFSASGSRLASAGLDKTVRLWEMPSGNCLHVLEGHSRFVACCAFSRDGSLLASGSNDKQLIVWGVKGDVSLDADLAVPMSVFREKLKSCTDSSVMADLIGEGGPHAVDDNSDEGNIRDVRLLQRLDAHSSSVNSCHLRGNDKLVTAGGDKLLRLWRRSSEDGRFAERTDISPVATHAFSINQVEFSPCGHFVASCSADGSAVLWNTRTGQRTPASFGSGNSAIRACRFSPDGRLLVTAGDDERISVWRTDTAELITSYEGHKEAVIAVAISPDSQFLASACSGGHFRGWSLLPCWDRCVMLTEDAHDLGVQSCDFSPVIDPQGYILATCGNDSAVRLWRVPTELGVSATPTFVGYSGAPASPLRSPKLAPSATPLRCLQGHGGNVMCVRFSPCSGEFLASTASDSTARIWSVHQGDCLFVLEGHSRQVTCCAFSADATILATGSLDKTVILWKLPDHIAYQNAVAVRLRGQHRRVLDWTPADVCNWLNRSLETSVNTALVYANDVDGCQLLTLAEDKLETILDIDEPNRTELRRQIRWLRLEEMEVLLPEISSGSNVPHDFLCPITREVMRDPVTCADGFTYERAAIEEWFLSGKLTSPMTNKTLPSLAYHHHSKLKREISQFLYGDADEADCPGTNSQEKK